MSTFIKHLRTGEIGKSPTAEQLEIGQIAINYADGGERLFIKNSDDKVVSFAVGDHTAFEGGETTTLTGQGTTAVPYKIEAKISAKDENALIVETDGLFVKVGEASVTGGSTDSITVTGNGTVADPIKAALIIDPVEGNLLTVSPTGAKVVLGDVTVKTADSNGITITGDGTTADPLTVALVIDPVAGNRLTNSETGLAVAAELPTYAVANKDQVLSVDDTGALTWVSTDPGEF